MEPDGSEFGVGVKDDAACSFLQDDQKMDSWTRVDTGKGSGRTPP